MGHDTLSDVLRTVRLRGAVFYYVSYRERWAAEAPAASEIAAAVMPGGQCRPKAVTAVVAKTLAR